MAVGDVVVTSGIDGIYPEGLRASAGSTSWRRPVRRYKRITVRPAVDFSALEEVLVVLTPTPARERRGEPRVKAAGVILAIAAGAGAPDDAGPVSGARHDRRRSGAGRGGLRGADVRAGRPGLLAGTLAGLVQDALSTRHDRHRRPGQDAWSGFLAGIIGTQFIVARPLPRFLVFFGATLLHQTITIGLGVVLGLRALGSPYAAVAGQALGNAVVGMAAFQLVELLPGAVERRRMAKTRLRR